MSEMEIVCFAVRAEYLNIIQVNLGLLITAKNKMALSCMKV